MKKSFLFLLFLITCLSTKAQPEFSEAAKILKYWKSLKSVYYKYDILSSYSKVPNDSIYFFGEAYFIMQPEDSIMYSDFYLHDEFFNSIYFCNKDTLHWIIELINENQHQTEPVNSIPPLCRIDRFCCLYPKGMNCSVPALTKILEELYIRRMTDG